jgi:hypothetical protein
MTSDPTDERLREIEKFPGETYDDEIARICRALLESREEVARLKEEIGIWSRTRAADVALHMKHKSRIAELEAALRDPMAALGNLVKALDRVSALEAALREADAVAAGRLDPPGVRYADRCHEVRAVVNRALAPAEEPAPQTKHICDSGDCGLDPCEEMPIHKEPAPPTCGTRVSGIIRLVGMDNDEIIEDCPDCRGGAK